MLLTSLNILPDTLKTGEVVKFLDSKKYHRKALYKDDIRTLLGARRKNKRKDFVFDTKKVIELKLKINK